MGLDINISKVNGIKLDTIAELEDYRDKNEYNEEIVILSFRKEYILDEWFRSNCKNSRPYDEFILTKDDFVSFINFYNEFLENDDLVEKNKLDFFSYNCEHNKNYISNIKRSIEDTIAKMQQIIDNEDFKNDTFFYYSDS